VFNATTPGCCWTTPTASACSDAKAGASWNIARHCSPTAPRGLSTWRPLGKAAGVFGAFVAGAPELIQWLVQSARGYIYTTATPPLLAVALRESLRLIGAEAWRREHLADLVTALREGLIAGRWTLMPSSTPIQPLLIGSSHEAVIVSEELRRRGFLVPAIRPPTVPKGTRACVSPVGRAQRG